MYRRRFVKKKSDISTAMRELVEEVSEGIVTSQDYTVSDAVLTWLAKGLRGRDDDTISKLTILANGHILELKKFASTKLSGTNGLTADDVDNWIEDRAEYLSTRSVREVMSILRRSINFAIKRQKAKRNVALLCDIPVGRKPGRPSKSLTRAQATALLNAAEADNSTIGDYIITSLLTGARTEEMRAIPVDLVDTKGRPEQWSEEDGIKVLEAPAIPPSISVWRSVRAHGDTKTRRSRRTLALPERAAVAVDRQLERRADHKKKAGKRWNELGILFCSKLGTQLDAANVRREFRRIVKAAGLDPDEWTPRELRHTFVSVLSDDGTPLETISLLVGHKDTTVTETVYRQQLRPVRQDGALIMDKIFRPRRGSSQ